MTTPKSNDEQRSTASSSPAQDDAWPLETVKATVEAARSDVLFETERMKTLDNKLVSIAAFSGVSLSVSGSVGASVVANGSLSLGFTIALGATLTFAVLLLLVAVLFCFGGLFPKDYVGLDESAARERVSSERLMDAPDDALAKIAASYYLTVLPRAREQNFTKAMSVSKAYRSSAAGLAGVVLGLVLTSVGSVV